MTTSWWARGGNRQQSWDRVWHNLIITTPNEHVRAIIVNYISIKRESNKLHSPLYYVSWQVVGLLHWHRSTWSPWCLHHPPWRDPSVWRGRWKRWLVRKDHKCIQQRTTLPKVLFFRHSQSRWPNGRCWWVWQARNIRRDNWWKRRWVETLFGLSQQHTYAIILIAFRFWPATGTGCL